MQYEIMKAVLYMTSQLYGDLPRRRVEIFAEELTRTLIEKFVNHWYPEAPEKGSGYRCIKVGCEFDPIDPVIEKAANNCGLNPNDVARYLPKELNLWIDPGEVSYRIGDKGVTVILYSSRRDSDNSSSSSGSGSDTEVTTAFNPEAKCFLPMDLNVFGKISPLSPTSISPIGSPFNVGLQPKFAPVSYQKRTNTPTFTAAAFAQTKFGSTKLKTTPKRPNRSPTEFNNYIKNRQLMQSQQTPISMMRNFGDNMFMPSSNQYAGIWDNQMPMDFNRAPLLEDTSGSFFNQMPMAPLSPIGPPQNGFRGQDRQSMENFNGSLNRSEASSPFQQLLLAN